MFSFIRRLLISLTALYFNYYQVAINVLNLDVFDCNWDDIFGDLVLYNKLKISIEITIRGLYCEKVALELYTKYSVCAWLSCDALATSSECTLPNDSRTMDGWMHYDVETPNLVSVHHLHALLCLGESL